MAFFAVSDSQAIEIATGKILWPRYGQRSFYIRKPGEAWVKTYAGAEFCPEAAGRLMNLRMARALFHDEWLTEFSSGPDRNTSQFIAVLDTCKRHGILAINVSQQCGNPGIEITRERFLLENAPFRFPISAFSGSSMKRFGSAIVHADLAIIHGNNHSPESKGARGGFLDLDPRAPAPLHLNEEDNGRDTSPKNLERELARCDAVWAAGGSWGCMPWRRKQMSPFRSSSPAGDSQDEAYFRAVLEHIRRKVFR